MNPMIGDDLVEFTVMHLDDPVAIVRISDEKRNVEIEKLVPDSIRQPFGGSNLDLWGDLRKKK